MSETLYTVETVFKAIVQHVMNMINRKMSTERQRRVNCQASKRPYTTVELLITHRKNDIEC